MVPCFDTTRYTLYKPPLFKHANRKRDSMLSIQRVEIQRVASREGEWTKRSPGASTRHRVHIFYSDTSGCTGAQVYLPANHGMYRMSRDIRDIRYMTKRGKKRKEERVIATHVFPVSNVGITFIQNGLLCRNTLKKLN
jgi:hypothetical protein